MSGYRKLVSDLVLHLEAEANRLAGEMPDDAGDRRRAMMALRVMRAAMDQLALAVGMRKRIVFTVEDWGKDYYGWK